MEYENDPETPEKDDKKSAPDIAEVRKEFEAHKEAWSHNHKTGLEDLKFSRGGDQWPEAIENQRIADGRPILTINKMPSFIRQVVNETRENKPSIKVHPVDSGADPGTAQVINGLIRNIEQVSSADVAYDTAAEGAVSNGFGWFRVGVDHSFDDSFEMDIMIERISNAFSIYPDPASTAADSSDWNSCFVTDRRTREQFKRDYEGKAIVDFEGDDWTKAGDSWIDEKMVQVAEYWMRKEVERLILKLDDGRVLRESQITNEIMALHKIVDEREVKSHEVTQHIVSGVEVIETNEWVGKFIPIVPVYGDEFDIEGKRYFRSLIHDAKDAQRMQNYWRTTATELVALAPRVPYIGEEGSFVGDGWTTANSENHAFLEYKKGGQMPQRQPLDSGTAAGALQEALNAMDDMKDIMSIHDASRGARSNETSGRAIIARQRQGDTATFHFQDNMSRSIRHAGRIIIDLIPKVYDGPRIVRVMGEDGTAENRKVNQPQVDERGQPLMDQNGKALQAMHDLTVGKYDLTVSAGPSYATRREESAQQMTEIIRAFPQAAPYIADIMARNFDWPGADEIAERFAKMNPSQEGQLPPEVMEMIQKGKVEIEKLNEELRALKADMSVEANKLLIEKYEAETDRMKTTREIAVEQVQLNAQPFPQLNGV